MGATASCHECECEDRSQTPTGTPSKARWLSFAEEEVCDPREKCKSWEPSLVVQRPAITPLKDMPTHIEKGRKGIDAERFLNFRLPPGDRFGLQLAEATSGTAAGLKLSNLLVVANVEDKSSFSQTADGQLGLTAGDVIVEANGRRGTAAEVRDVLQQAVAGSGHRQVTLVVRPRPSAFDVEMRRQGPHWETLGITVVIDKTNPGCALVNALRSEGLVPDWNKTHGSLRICVGDLITQVNDVNEDATSMCKEVQEGRRGSVLRFRVRTSIAGQAVARRVSCQALPFMSEKAEVTVGTGPKACAHTEVTEYARAAAEAKSCMETEAQAHLEAKAEARAHAEAEAARHRFCAESAERLHSEIRAREQLLRHDVALEAIAWDTGNADVMEAPPPLASPAQGARSRVEADAMSNVARGCGGAPPAALDSLGCEISEAAGSEASFDSEEDGMRVVLQFSPSKRQADEASGQPPTEQFPLGGCEQSSRLDMPWGAPWGADVGSWFEVLRLVNDNGREEDVLSDASTDFPCSGARTPSLAADFTSGAQMPVRPRRARTWV